MQKKEKKKRMFFGSDHDHQILQYPPAEMERKWKSNVELAPWCPRCASSNTKFCYYNNYSLSQPRYFCKGCRRYWTKGGSLRNVPVGGSCRKSRRAKVARRVSENSVNQSKSFGSFDDGRNEQITDGESSVDRANGGSDIDLAVVFAKFLKESSSSEPEFASQEMANNSSNSSTPETVPINDGILMESQNPSGHHLVIGDGNLLQEFPQVFDMGKRLLQEEDPRVQNLLENDINAYGLQTLWSDDHEIVQDDLWTEASANATLPNFTWQPMLQIQDFDSCPADGQLKTPANLITDNWSSFDLSGFDVYSRPLL